MRIISNKDQQAGFSLIEILVSLVIIAVGLIGLIQLQVWSLKQNTDALTFSSAANVADDAFARMKVNPLATAAGAYNTTFDNDNASTINCESSACGSANRALWDLNNLEANVAEHFDDGDFELQLVGNVVTFTVRYPHGRADSVTNQGEYEHISFSSRI